MKSTLWTDSHPQLDAGLRVVGAVGGERLDPRGRKAHQCFHRVIENGNGGEQILAPYKVRNSSEKRKAKYRLRVEVVKSRISSHAV